MDSNSIFGGLTLLPPLSPDEQEELILRLPDLEAKDILISRNQRLVLYISQKFVSSGISIEDLVSIGTIGLIKAINTFSIDRNVKLSTYASRCIENEILMVLRKKRVTTISFDDFISSDLSENHLRFQDVIPDSSQNDFIQAENRELISSVITFALNSFSRNELLAFLYRLGGKNQNEVAASLNLSQSYISRLLNKIYGKMNNYKKEQNVLNYQKNFIFNMLDENMCCIKISRNEFPDFDKIFIRFLLNKESFISVIKLNRFSTRYIVEIPFTIEIFVIIADLIKFMEEVNH